MRIGVIGTGVIASAVVESLAGKGYQITVSMRNEERSELLAQRFQEVLVSLNQGVIDQSDVVFLGLMAEHAPEILADLTFRPDQKVISLMAGASLDEVAEMVAPASAEAVMIPFPVIAKGGSPILVRGNERLIKRMFAPDNQVIPLADDAALETYLAAQAILSPVVKIVHDASRWLAGKTGDNEQAELFLSQLVAACLLKGETAELLQELNTPGGYNQRLREHMVAAGMSTALLEGLDDLAQPA